MLFAESFSNLNHQDGKIRSVDLEEDRMTVVLAYGHNDRPHLDVYNGHKRCRLPELLQAYLLKMSESIEGMVRVGIETGIITEAAANGGADEIRYLLEAADTCRRSEVKEVLCFLEAAKTCAAYLLPPKSAIGASDVASLLAQYQVNLEKCGFVDDLDEDLLNLGTAAGLAEEAVKKEMAERAVILFLRDLDPRSGSMLKVNRARKMFDFIGRVGIEWIKTTQRFPVMRDIAERILMFPIPKNDPLKGEIDLMYSKMLRW